MNFEGLCELVQNEIHDAQALRNCMARWARFGLENKLYSSRSVR